jgi:hypothetical protein
MKRLLVAVLIIGFGVYDYLQSNSGGVSVSTEQRVQANQDITNAYQNRLSDVQVRGTGIVKKTLRDDNEGSRHQKFILRMASGESILIAHNIDLAPKITSLKSGDEVEFYGEYEWNSKGGVVHWTHHDPRGRHVGGWLKHNGRKYE